MSGAVLDEQLMERIQEGDRNALGELFERHALALQAFLLRMVRDRALAEDLVQVTFLSVFRSARGYQRDRKVAPWLFSIAANAARDSLRRTKLHGRAMGMTADDSLFDHNEQPPLTEPSHRRALQRAFAQLPTLQRQCVVMRRLEHLSFAQIAALLDISETAARLRAHRGSQQLRVLLHVEHAEMSRA
jgi:RNA polymerase sigma factor (sigma-70 family)